MAATDESARTRVHGALLQDIEREAEGVVRWFYDQMPDYYFLSHEEPDIRRHLRGILSGQVMEEGQELVLSGPSPGKFTYLTPGGDMRGLVAVLEQLRDQDIRTARIYETRDRRLRLDTFLLAPQCSCDATSETFAAIMDDVRERGLVAFEDLEDFRRFLASATEDYVRKFEPRRVIRHFNMWRSIRETERVHVRREPADTPGLERIIMAMTRPPTTELLLLAARIFARAGLDVERAYGDVFGECDGEEAAILSFYLRVEEQGLSRDSAVWEAIERDLATLKWFAPHELEVLADEEGYSLSRVMLVQASCEFAHQHLLRQNLYAYTSERIVRSVLRNRETLRVVLEYFDARFEPGVDDRAERMRRARDAARESLQALNTEVVRNIFGCMLRFFHYTLRTNYFLPNRFGLAFRLDPNLFTDMEKGQRPYGVYFFHGPFSQGFHVRYREMSRGGVRMVPTKTQESFEIESNRLFDEVVKLASAQQYKNKDIPEGGSKAVLLLGPKADPDIALSCMVDGLLDLIAAEAGLPAEVVDYLDQKEIIYLGPDENVTPAHIEWIVARARRRGYTWPCALMSSKPRTGINHKEYGVTSEGVVVFAEQALRSLGIDPRLTPFTVKLTGGPAGDVASNCMRILRREFGDNARIVAMSDGHGAACDPQGLDHGELERLIQAGQRADSFNQELLHGDGGFVVSAANSEGARLRDELHNKVRADLFIPAGGRPDTINERNWRLFLDDAGRPSARIIVEGANIFISPGARRRLEDAGVLAVPGPSANKTGVICSSYEILAGLVLADEEFLSVKERYVQEVLAILRKRALDEARLILREYKLRGGRTPLSELSHQLSVEINDLGDAVREGLQAAGAEPGRDDDLAAQVRDYCPAVMAEAFGDRVVERAPRPYLLSLLASAIASRMVYQEGLGFVSGLAEVKPMQEIVAGYLVEERRVESITAEVLRTQCSDRLEVARIVESLGRRRLLLERLGLV